MTNGSKNQSADSAEAADEVELDDAWAQAMAEDGPADAADATGAESESDSDSEEAGASDPDDDWAAAMAEEAADAETDTTTADEDADMADAWATAMAESDGAAEASAPASGGGWRTPEPPAHQLVNENPAAEALEEEIAELREVIHQTEEAAVRILSYVESVSLAVEALAPRDGGLGRTAARGARDGLMQIAEACSFQDLTGQRLEAVARRLEMVIEGELRPRDMSAEEAGLAQTGASEPELDQAAIDALFD